MVPFFVQIKCQLGKSYDVANKLADAKIASEIYSTAGDYLKFLRAIDKAVPDDFDIHIGVDNLATHKTPAIKEWLARRPRFTPISRPPADPG